jgi:Sigma-70 region 2
MAGRPFLSPNGSWSTIARIGADLCLSKRWGSPWATSIDSWLRGRSRGPRRPVARSVPGDARQRRLRGADRPPRADGPEGLPGISRNPSDAQDAFQATFLVLAKKARALRGRANLGGWLHLVAYRAAIRANGAPARRRVQERRASEMSAMTPSHDPVIPDELLPALHQGIARLPERLRLAVVLCDVQRSPKPWPPIRCDGARALGNVGSPRVGSGSRPGLAAGALEATGRS